MTQLAVTPQAPGPRRRSSVARLAAACADPLVPLVHHVEDLGLFLRGALPAELDADADVARAVERMAQNGAEPPPNVLQALRADADAIAARLARGCSPAQLCVLLDTLRVLSARATPPPALGHALAPLATAAASTPDVPTTTTTDAPSLDRAIAATSDAAPSSSSAPQLLHYAHLHARLEAAVREAVASNHHGNDHNDDDNHDGNDEDDGSDDDRALALDGDAATLRAGVVAALSAARHCERVAQLLLAMPPLATALPLGCVDNLRALASSLRVRWGRGLLPLAAAVAQELAAPAAQAALALAFTRAGSAPAIHELMLDAGRAATASLSGDVLALLTALHGAAAACGRQRDFGFHAGGNGGGVEIAPDVDEYELGFELDLDEDAAAVLRRKQEDARQFAMTVQRVLPSLTAVAALRSRTVDELARAAERGAALSREALADLAAHWDGVLAAMPLASVRRTAAQLERLAAEAGGGLVEDVDDQWRALLARTQRAAADSARAVEQLSTQAVDLYAASRPRAQSVMGALERHTAAQRREAKMLRDDWARPALAVVETAYDEAARGAHKSAAEAAREASSWLAALKRKLPSLSKLEIVRDFAQVISLVFTNLYTVALERAPETVGRVQRNLNVIQSYLRGFANFFAADFTAVLLRFSHTRFEQLAPDVFFAGLIAAILVGGVCVVVIAAATFMDVDPAQDVTHAKSALAPRDASLLARFAARFRKQLTITRVTVLLTVCQSLHLPVARLCVEILTGSEDTSSVHRRYRHRFFWAYLYRGAVVLLVVYVGGLIALLAILIYRNAPKVETPPAIPQRTWRAKVRQWWQRAASSRHLAIVDLDGTRVEFRNSVYAAILARDPTQLRCPYRSLYAGFERRWRYYKVVQLSMKVVLTMLLIWIADPRVRALTTLGVTALSFVSTLTAPFIDDFDDRLEQCAKFTALVTCLGGVVLVYFPDSDTEWTQLTAVVVTAVNLLNGVLMVAITCFGSDGVKASYKALRGELLFSDSRRYAADKPARQVLPDWDVAHEVRHRVWHPFWKRTLLSLGEHEAIERLAHGKVDEERVAAITAKLARDEGKPATGKTRRQSQAETAALAEQRHWVGQADECVAAVRTLVCSVLEGSDVYFEAPGRRSGFGRLTVVAYPFHGEFQFDDADDHEGHRTTIGIVEDCEVAALLFLNFRADVARRRVVRQQLRALSAWAQPIELPLERDEPWADGGDDGGKLAKATPSTPPTVRPTTMCHCRYSRGVVRVADAADGRFLLSVQYGDGMGEVTCPETGQVLHCVINRRAMVEGDAALALLGVTREFDDSAALREILSRPEVARALATHLPDVRAAQRGAREHKLKRQHDSDAVLGRGFRYMVYNNPRVSRRDLETYLAEAETNPQLQKIAVTRRAALDLLYEKMRYLHADPRVAFWYVFWHDVFEQNANEIAEVRANKRHLDPDEPMSIAYEVLPKHELRRWLERRGLWGERRLLGFRWRKVLFHTELLDLLYESMERQATQPKLAPVWVA